MKRLLVKDCLWHLRYGVWEREEAREREICAFQSVEVNSLQKNKNLNMNNSGEFKFIFEKITKAFKNKLKYSF